ncbi:hypothetical protein EV426DRAFT_577969 [Tirmania nivea]|nr:hypothetical protein EV426DRAFT_577969 [Tirmania nivea]
MCPSMCPSIAPSGSSSGVVDVVGVSTNLSTPTHLQLSTTNSPLDLTGDVRHGIKKSKKGRRLPWGPEISGKGMGIGQLQVVGVSIAQKSLGHWGVEATESTQGQATDDLGTDVDDREEDGVLGERMFLKMDYGKRNLQAARRRRVRAAERIANELYGFKLKAWQAGIPWDLKNYKDVMCIVGTGSGKTMKD